MQVLNSELNCNEFSAPSSIVNEIVFISRNQNSQIIMYELDLVWECLYLVGVEMIVQDIHNFKLFQRMRMTSVPSGTSDIFLTEWVKFVLGK